MIKKTVSIILIILIGVICSCGNKKAVPETSANSSSIIEAVEPIIAEPSRAEKTMKTLVLAYPDVIEKAELRNDDWAVLMRGKWYYYAGGRLLPESQLENSANYRPQQFYGYPKDLPEWKKPTEEETTRYSSWTRSRSQNQTKRSNFLLDDLWQASTRVQTENNLVRITFLGKSAKVHKEIKEQLSLVETRIQSAAKTDPELQIWINNIGNLEGYGWRNIADTQARSYHSYGLAVDLLPKNLRGKQTYWLWTSQYRDDWWNVSYNERYHPPEAVIKAFEAYGFVWGGKWPLFDTMHFEYRPEIFIYNGLHN
jgi:hypothetical protein